MKSRKSRGKHVGSAGKPRSVDSSLIAMASILMLTIMILGGFVLYLKLRPQDSPATLGSGLLQTAQGLVANNPDNATAHAGLGAALLQVGRPAEAKPEFEKALELDPDNWGANLQLALMIKETDPTRAAKLLNTSAKNAPSSETPYLELGDLYYDQGMYKEAKNAYVLSIASDPNLYDSHFGLGQTYVALGQKEKAMEQYKQALRFIPGDQAARDAIAELSGRSGSEAPASP